MEETIGELDESWKGHLESGLAVGLDSVVDRLAIGRNISCQLVVSWNSQLESQLAVGEIQLVFEKDSCESSTSWNSQLEIGGDSWRVTCQLVMTFGELVGR